MDFDESLALTRLLTVGNSRTYIRTDDDCTLQLSLERTHGRETTQRHYHHSSGSKVKSTQF